MISTLDENSLDRNSGYTETLDFLDDRRIFEALRRDREASKLLAGLMGQWARLQAEKGGSK